MHVAGPFPSQSCIFLARLFISSAQHEHSMQREVKLNQRISEISVCSLSLAHSHVIPKQKCSFLNVQA